MNRENQPTTEQKRTEMKPEETEDTRKDQRGKERDLSLIHRDQSLDNTRAASNQKSYRERSRDKDRMQEMDLAKSDRDLSLVNRDLSLVNRDLSLYEAQLSSVRQRPESTQRPESGLPIQGSEDNHSKHQHIRDRDLSLPHQDQSIHGGINMQPLQMRDQSLHRDLSLKFAVQGEERETSRDQSLFYRDLSLQETLRVKLGLPTRTRLEEIAFCRMFRRANNGKIILQDQRLPRINLSEEERRLINFLSMNHATRQIYRCEMIARKIFNAVYINNIHTQQPQMLQAIEPMEIFKAVYTQSQQPQMLQITEPVEVVESLCTHKRPQQTQSIEPMLMQVEALSGTKALPARIKPIISRTPESFRSSNAEEEKRRSVIEAESSHVIDEESATSQSIYEESKGSLGEESIQRHPSPHLSSSAEDDNCMKTRYQGRELIILEESEEEEIKGEPRNATSAQRPAPKPVEKPQSIFEMISRPFIPQKLLPYELPKHVAEINEGNDFYETVELYSPKGERHVLRVFKDDDIFYTTKKSKMKLLNKLQEPDNWDDATDQEWLDKNWDTTIMKGLNAEIAFLKKYKRKMQKSKCEKSRDTNRKVPKMSASNQTQKLDNSPVLTHQYRTRLQSSGFSFAEDESIKLIMPRAHPRRVPTPLKGCTTKPN